MTLQRLSKYMEILKRKLNISVPNSPIRVIWLFSSNIHVFEAMMLKDINGILVCYPLKGGESFEFQILSHHRSHCCDL